MARPLTRHLDLAAHVLGHKKRIFTRELDRRGRVLELRAVRSEGARGRLSDARAVPRGVDVPQLRATACERLERRVGQPAVRQVRLAHGRAREDELLDAGVKVDSKDRRGYTAMISAARYNQDMCARALIAAGASQDTATDDGWTPLVMCARKGH